MFIDHFNNTGAQINVSESYIEISNFPVFQRTYFNMFFEEIIEMGDFDKTQCKSNF